MPKSALPIPVLNDDQKRLIEKNWDMPLKELTQLVFNNPRLNGHNVEAKAVKMHLATLGKTANTTLTERIPLELTQDQKDYIVNNAAGANGPMELVRALWPQPDGMPALSFNSREARAVFIYTKEINPDYKREDEPVEEVEYTAPVSIVHLISKVNRYAISPRSGDKALMNSSDGLTPHQRRQLEALLSYLKTPVFKVTADKYDRKIDRELLESTFISFCWDKDELTAPEMHQYILYADLAVKSAQIDRQLQVVDRRFNEALQDSESVIRQAEVELLNSIREKSGATLKAIAAISKSLEGERKDRDAARKQGSATMHNLVAAMREAESRHVMAKLANKTKAALHEEVERLSTMDSIRAELFGLSKAEILK